MTTRDSIVTKNFLEQKLQAFGMEIFAKMDQQKEELKRELKEEISEDMDDKLTRLKSDIFVRLDQYAGKQVKEEEEEAAGALAQKRMSDQLEDHEERIITLEKN